MKMWILLHILAYFFNINVILGNLLETFEIFTNHLFCQRSGCAGCIVTPRRSLVATCCEVAIIFFPARNRSKITYVVLLDPFFGDLFFYC